MAAEQSIDAAMNASSATGTAKPIVLPCGRLARCVILLLAGFAAGLLAYKGIERSMFSFPLSDEIAALAHKERPTPEEARRVDAAIRLQAYQITSLQVAIFGAAAGGLLGLAAGAARRSTASALLGFVGGTVLGAVAGAAGGIADLYLLEWLWSHDLEITFKSMAAHTTAFVVAGIGIGIAVGLAARRVVPTLGVVLAAALIAGLTYSGLAAYLFPITNTNAAVPAVGHGELLLWTLMPAVLMGLAIARTNAFIPEPTRVAR